MVDWQQWEMEQRQRTIRETPYLRDEPENIQRLMYAAMAPGKDGQALRNILQHQNPDARTKQGHTALWVSCAGGGSGVPYLIPALEKHYANDPQKLLHALTATPKFKKSNHPSTHQEDWARDFGKNWPAHYLQMEAIERAEVKVKDPHRYFEVIECLKSNHQPVARYVQFLQDYMNNGVSANSDGPNRASLLWHMADCEQGDTASKCGRIVLTKLLQEYPPSSKPRELLVALTDVNRTGDGKLPGERFAERKINGLSQEIERAIAEAKQALAVLPSTPNASTTTNPSGQPTIQRPQGRSAAKPSQPARPPVSFTRGGISYDKLMRMQGGVTVLEQLCERDELNKVFTPEIWKGRQEEMLMAWHEVPARHQHQVDIDNVAVLVGGSRSDRAKASAQQPREPGF